MEENTVKRTGFNDVASFDAVESKSTFVKTQKEKENFEELQRLKQWGAFLELIYNSGDKNGKIPEHEQDRYIELVEWRKSTMQDWQINNFEETKYEEVYREFLNIKKGE